MNCFNYAENDIRAWTTTAPWFMGRMGAREWGWVYEWEVVGARREVAGAMWVLGGKKRTMVGTRMGSPKGEAKSGTRALEGTRWKCGKFLEMLLLRLSERLYVWQQLGAVSHSWQTVRPETSKCYLLPRPFPQVCYRFPNKMLPGVPHTVSKNLSSWYQFLWCVAREKQTFQYKVFEVAPNVGWLHMVIRKLKEREWSYTVVLHVTTLHFLFLNQLRR